MSGHIQDLWTSPGDKGRRVRNSRYGKGKRWQARWTEDRGDTTHEKAKAFDSKAAAEAHLARIAVHGPELPRPRVTFWEYAETWRLSQVHHRTHTIAALDGIFAKMLKPQLGRLPITEITRQDVQNAVIEWASHYSPTTVIQAYGYTRTVFADAIFNRVLTESPCQRISLPAKDRKRIVPLTPEHVKAITAAMPKHLTAAVTLAAATGLRIGEIGGLGREHLNNGVVSVERQLVDSRNGQPIFGPPKTKSSVRDVSMGTVAWTAMLLHLETYENQHGLVFGTNRGTPLHRRSASQAWRTATKKMSLPDGHGWHALRHFHASALIAAGRSPRAVADRLGHGSVNITLNVYSHLWGTDDSESVDAIDRILGSGPDPEAE